MYLDFFGFQKKPFESVPDPDFFYESPIHREALAAITYAVDNDKGIIVVTGGVGTGKTTIARYYMKTLSSNVHGIYVDYPFESLYALMRFLALNVGLRKDEIPDTVIELSARLKDKLLELSESKGKVVLIIDESQHLSRECLEYIRLLSNLSYDNERLINIVLIGQNELLEKLNSKELRQLKQRVSVWVTISPFNMEQTYNYIKHRILLAGSYDNPFTSGALKFIYRKSNGIPRLINMICDCALLAGYTENKRKISSRLVRKALKETSLQGIPKFNIRWVHFISTLLILIVIFTLWIKFKVDVDTKPISSLSKPIRDDSSSYIAPAGSFLDNVEIMPRIHETVFNDANFLIYSSQVVDEDMSNQIRDRVDKESGTDYKTSVSYTRGRTYEYSEKRTLSFPKHDKSYLKKFAMPPVKVNPKDYMLKIIKKTYGKSNSTILDIVQTANSEIKDINLIKIGQKIILPRLSVDTFILDDGEKHYFLHYYSFYNKKTAYKKLLELSSLSYPMSLYTVKLGNNEVYRIYVGPFSSREKARRVFKLLPKDHLPF